MVEPHQTQLDGAASSLDSDSHTEDNFLTPTETRSSEQDQFIKDSPTLQPGHTYIIQSVPCGRMLTLLEGEVVLARYDTLGSIYWACIESNGWLGLRNVASGKFLRHAGPQSGLSCSNSSHGTWERLRIRRVDGEGEGGGGKGHTLFMEHWGSLKPVGITTRAGEEKLDRLTETDTGKGLAWMFFEADGAERK